MAYQKGVTKRLKEYLLSSDFARDLTAFYERYEVLSEGGLRTTVAWLVREHLGTLPSDAEYRVTCETRLLGVNVIPDILVWRNGHPRIWIELKDTGGFHATKAHKDWEKLQTYCVACSSIKLGWMIYVARTGLPVGFPRSTTSTRRFRPVTIAIRDHIKMNFTKWEKEYQRRAGYRISLPPATVEGTSL